MFIARFDIGVCAEVNLDHIAHNSFTVENLLDTNRGILVVEGDDDAREGLEGRPSVNGRRGVDKVLDGEEVLRAEDIFRGEVGNDKGVGGRSWQAQRR